MTSPNWYLPKEVWITLRNQRNRVINASQERFVDYCEFIGGGLASVALVPQLYEGIKIAVEQGSRGMLFASSAALLVALGLALGGKYDLNRDQRELQIEL